MSLHILASNPSLHRVKHIIGIAAGKGGVGKSSITVHLARALKDKGYQVGILDADIYGPSLTKMLRPEEMPGIKEDVVVPAVSEGIKYISVGFFKNKENAQVIRAPIATQIISQFTTEVVWGELDYLLIDFPPGTGDIQLALMQKMSLTGMLLVTSPQEIALMDVRKAFLMAETMGVSVLGVIENFSYLKVGDQVSNPFGKGGGDRLAKEINRPLLATIPLDANLSNSCDDGRPLPDGDLKKIFEFMASSLNETVSAFYRQ